MPEKLDLPAGQVATLLSKKHRDPALVKRLGDYLRENLNAQERHLLMLHYNDGLTLADVARVLNVSTEYAVRLHANLIERVQTEFGSCSPALHIHL